MTTNIIEKMRAQLKPEHLKGAGAFEPKLTFRQRCEILALDVVGAKRTQSAAVYKIARPTVAYICNPASRYYRNVRQELADLGKDRFVETYLTAEVMETYNAYERHVRAILNDEDDKAERRTEANAAGPNKTARGKAGRFSVWDEHSKFTEHIDVEWLEVGTLMETFSEPGWYLLISEATMKARGWGVAQTIWPGVINGEVPPFATSQAALNAYLKANEYTVLA